MNPEKLALKKVGKRVGLAGASLLAMFQVACAKVEPIVQVPTPSQGVTQEAVPPEPIPESLPVEKPQVEAIQIEECQPQDVRGPIGSETTPFTRFRLSKEMRLRKGPALAAPEVTIVSVGDSVKILCMRPQIQEGRIFVTSLFEDPNSSIMIGWGESGEPRIEELMLRAVRAKTSEPTPVAELARFYQEIQVLDIYRGELLIMSGEQRGKFGNILISRLPDNRILVGYNRLKPCEDGTKPTPIFLVRPDAVRGGGFQWNSPQEDLVVLLQGPSLGGQIITKDIARPNLNCTGNPEPAVYSARKQERGGTTTGLYTALSQMLSEVDPRMTPQSMKDIVERLYGGPLPDPAK